MVIIVLSVGAIFYFACDDELIGRNGAGELPNVGVRVNDSESSAVRNEDERTVRGPLENYPLAEFDRRLNEG